MDRLTYFRLKSQYEEDITKNCALDGYEVDNNFYTLEGRDVKAISVNGEDIVITLYNGKEIKAEEALSDFITDIKFDKINGVLKITQNGITEEISGFATDYNVGNTVSVDGTLKGNGLPSNPVGISTMAETGQFKPVKRIIDITKGERLPSKQFVFPGDRFLTEESVSNYGLLYNYKAVKKIACDLAESNSGWRIPTKDDWDDMLDAVEPCDADRNHSSATGNKYLGKWAGKLLKSVDLWKPESCGPVFDDEQPRPERPDCPYDDYHHPHHHHHYDCPDRPMPINDEDSSTCFDYSNSDMCEVEKDYCSTKYCGEYGKPFPPHPQPGPCPPPFPPKPLDENRGLDKYGFRVTPAGYADDGQNFLFFRERACFWTASNSKMTTAYVKRFEYNKSKVHQDVIAGQNYMSLRLVKDYDGDNYNEREDILGSTVSTVLMPSVKKGKAIWTSVNVAFGNKNYESLIPNDGQGMSFVTHYFINEWDGKKWLRNELKEGQSVVIMKAPHHKDNAEFRVVHNHLVNVMHEVYGEVIKAVDKDLHKLNHKIDDEIARSITKDNEIDGKIAEINETTFNLDQRLTKAEGDIVAVNGRVDETNATVSHINQTLADFGEETAKAFEQINNVITTSVNTINAAIEAERVIRAEKDTELQNAIEKEITDRTEEDAKLQLQIDSNKDWIDATAEKLEEEKAFRIEEDAKLQANIDKVAEDLAILAEKEAQDKAECEEHYEELKEALRIERNNRISNDEDIRKDFAEKLEEERQNRIKNDSEERNNRIANDEKLQKAIDDEAEQRQINDAELVRRDAEIEGKLIVQEGTSFDKEKGILTLKSLAGTNDITVQFSGNFGTF